MLCPECGRYRAGIKDAPHYREHYPEVLDPARTDPRARAVAHLLRNGGVDEDTFRLIKDGEKPDQLREALRAVGSH